MADRSSMKVGGRYNWRNQPERLVYIGLCEPRNGPWHQFEKVGEPGVVWCEVLDADLPNIEESSTAAAGVTLDVPKGSEPQQLEQAASKTSIPPR